MARVVLGQRATQREWAVTFAPSQVITTEEWKKRHQNHTVVTHVEEVSIKRMHWLVCMDCNERHLFRMETIDERPT